MADFNEFLSGSPIAKVGLAAVTVIAIGIVGFMAVNSSACNSQSYGPQVKPEDTMKTAEAAIKAINADTTLTQVQKDHEIARYKAMESKAQGNATPATGGPPNGVPGGATK